MVYVGTVSLSYYILTPKTQQEFLSLAKILLLLMTFLSCLVLVWILQQEKSKNKKVLRQEQVIGETLAQTNQDWTKQQNETVSTLV